MHWSTFYLFFAQERVYNVFIIFEHADELRSRVENPVQLISKANLIPCGNQGSDGFFILPTNRRHQHMQPRQLAKILETLRARHRGSVPFDPSRDRGSGAETIIGPADNIAFGFQGLEHPAPVVVGQIAAPLVRLLGLRKTVRGKMRAGDAAEADATRAIGAVVIRKLGGIVHADSLPETTAKVARAGPRGSHRQRVSGIRERSEGLPPVITPTGAMAQPSLAQSPSFLWGDGGR